MEIFNSIVVVADGLLTLFGLAALFIKPLRDRITKAKERDKKTQENFDNLSRDVKEIKEKQAISEKDELRTQLLLLLADYPTENAEIMKLAKHYFSDLDGNWYLTSLFNRWMETNSIAKPEWFRE